MSDAPSLRFAIGADGAIRLPVDPKPVFGKTRAPVVVAIGAYAYRSTVFAMDGGWFVPFRASHRAAAGFVAGDAVEVVLTLDTVLRTVEPHADLAEAIDDAGLRTVWDALSYTYRREHAEAVEAARKPETRARRIAACLAMLAARR